MKCKKCENIHRDPRTNMMICLTCGAIYEESQIAVDELEFDENQNAAGTFMDINKPTFFYRGGRNTLSQMFDPSQRNLKNTFKIMERTANILTITDDVLKKAQNIYILAAKNKFTQGRKTELLVGAILYLACRWNNTKHLLIDFSEVLRINLFLIGSIYLKLARILKIKINIIDDPSIYIPRFCKKFKFGNKVKQVEETAEKILQYMGRDWITQGRRPSGLCGACILIAAKLHKLNIDINLVSKVVHSCPQTILNRIEEFSLTRVASMTMEEFAIFNNWDFYPRADPPAFLKNLKGNDKQKEKKEEESNEEKSEEKNIKSKTSEEKIENGQSKNDNDIDNNNGNFSFKEPQLSLSKNNSFKNDRLNLRKSNSGMSKNINYNDSFTLRPRNSELSGNNNDSFFARPFNDLYGNNDKSDLLAFKPSNSVISKTNKDFSFAQSNSGENKSKRFNELKPTSTADEKLSMIPDNEDYKYIYSKDEYGIRKELWEVMFKDWIEQQKEKEEKEDKKKKLKVKEPRKRNKKVIVNDGNKKSAFEAIKSSNKFGKKINFSYIKSIMSKRK